MNAIFSFSTRLLSRRLSNQAVTLTSMSHVYVRSVPYEDKIQINVGYNNKTYNLERRKDEEWTKSTVRLQTNIEKTLNNVSRKKKRRTGEPEGPPPKKAIHVFLQRNGETLDENVPNVDAWNTGVDLVIGDDKFQVEINRPTVKLLILPKSMLSGFLVFPRIETEFSNSTDNEFIWYRETKPSAANNDLPTKSSLEVSRGFFYTPTNADIGYRLRIGVIPRNGNRVGSEMYVVSKFEVEAGPGLCPFENRHLYTKDKSAEGSLRVVCYNILADVYADTEYTKTVLFPYCPPYALKYDYRKHLILKELVGYNGDVICLQEVDAKCFDYQLVPALSVLGFKGIFKPKTGSSEGAALFYQESKLRLLEQHDIDITPEIKTGSIYSDIWQKVSELPALKTFFEDRTNILQMGVFECVEKPGHVLCIANTHLFFHPNASHIRLLQIAVCMRHLQDILTQVSFIFCGDFNSCPKSGVNTFMTTQHIPSDYHLWNSNGVEEKLTTLELHHSLNIESGCGYCDYTNYTTGFHEQLDYIFIDSNNLRVTQIIPQPDHGDITAHIALPSIVAPSDHIAQICDIQWK
ncbi:hypothetical protein LOTGIDRAFT_201951 [Lottia gigantea]|uniref:2',5'-phosphodiesterase 12 n=1 Tax=Lottia gigantea TaxID=225164 RepID=V3ZYZ5_LOTGI|nr:hypothetical protein LOTGIDRAFT_201951 [Lottia gigantea]ESO96768.1 hypothetical protein LOTGIDRAFT_201951 [Lottia gigantea]